MSINIFYEKDFYTNFTNENNSPHMFKENDINYEGLNKEIDEKIRSIKKEFDFQFKNIEDIEENNKSFAQLNNMENIPVLSVNKSKEIALKCREQRRNLMNAFVNLSPETVEKFVKAKIDFQECLRQNKI